MIPADPRVVRIGPDGQHEVTVRVLNIRQIAHLVELFKDGKLDKLSAGADVFELLEVLPGEMIGMVMISTALSREQLDEATADQFLELLSTILELNRDFFFRKIGPALRVLLAQVALVSGIRQTLDGSQPFSASSALDTGIATSSSSLSPSSMGS